MAARARMVYPAIPGSIKAAIMKHMLMLFPILLSLAATSLLDGLVMMKLKQGLLQATPSDYDV